MKKSINRKSIFIALLSMLSILFISIGSAINNNLLLLPLGIMMFFLLYYRTDVSIVLLILLNEDFFNINILKKDYHLILLGYCILLFIVYLIKVLNKKVIDKNNFIKNISLILFIVFIEVINSYYINKQPIKYGVISIQIFFRYLIYFYLIVQLKSNNMINKLKTIIIYMGNFASILYIIQASLYPRIIFLDVAYSYRDGHVRFYTGISIIIFALIINLNEIIIKNKKVNIVFLIINSVYFIFVCRTRNINISLIFTFLIIYFINPKIRSIINKSMKILIPLTLILSIYLLNNNIRNIDIIDDKNVIQEIKSKEGSAYFRIKEIEFYMEQLKENKWLGLGFYSDSYYGTYYIMGRNQNFYTVDIGIIGFLYHVGILGTVIFLYPIIKVFKLSRKIKDSDNILFYEFTSVFILISMYATFMMKEAQSIIYVAIFISFFDSDLKINNNRV